MSSPKELHFFDRHYERGLDWYASCFSPSASQTHVGEATPIYLYKTSARDRMARDLPHAKFLCILRNPVDRAYSHYWHAREKGPETAPTFERALRREARRIERVPDRQPAAFSYVDRGKYVEQLVALGDAVGRGRLHVLLIDDLLAEPVNTLTTVFDFLDVGSEVARSMVLPRSNSYGEGEASRQDGLPSRRLRDRGDLPTGSYPPMSDETRTRLIEIFTPYNRSLSDWLGRSLDAWNAR